ncbi:MAG: 50S ribosomal protein L18 [Patescibacteria group bacterium]
MNSQKLKNKKVIRRKIRTRAKISGTKERPRLSVFRSNNYTFAQLIDDESKNTMIGASTKDIKKSGAKEKKSKTAAAESLGELIGKKALEKGIKKIIFDRGPYKYHGRIKSVAEGAKKGGLQF